MFVVEETHTNCGICGDLSRQITAQNSNCRVFGMDLGDKFVTHGAMDTLYKQYGIDAQSVAAYVQEVLKVEN